MKILENASMDNLDDEFTSVEDIKEAKLALIEVKLDAALDEMWKQWGILNSFTAGAILGGVVAERIYFWSISISIFICLFMAFESYLLLLEQNKAKSIEFKEKFKDDVVVDINMDSDSDIIEEKSIKRVKSTHVRFENSSNLDSIVTNNLKESNDTNNIEMTGIESQHLSNNDLDVSGKDKTPLTSHTSHRSNRVDNPYPYHISRQPSHIDYNNNNDKSLHLSPTTPRQDDIINSVSEDVYNVANFTSLSWEQRSVLSKLLQLLRSSERSMLIQNLLTNRDRNSTTDTMTSFRLSPHVTNNQTAVDHETVVKTPPTSTLHRSKSYSDAFHRVMFRTDSQPSTATTTQADNLPIHMRKALNRAQSLQMKYDNIDMDYYDNK